MESGGAQIELIDPDMRIIAPDEEYLNKYSQRRDGKFSIIESIVCKEPDIYIPGKRGRLVKETAEQFKKQVNWVYTLLKKYWFYGKNSNGLLNDYFDVGIKNSESNRKKIRVLNLRVAKALLSLRKTKRSLERRSKNTILIKEWILGQRTNICVRMNTRKVTIENITN